MTDREVKKPTAHELMELHAGALFTHDRNMRLRTINEPWPGEAAAPRFFLGRTIEGTSICRFRHDVSEELVRQLEDLRADEPKVKDFRTKPKHLAAYMNLLQGVTFTTGPCFEIPGEAVPSIQVTKITRGNMEGLLHGGFEWLASEIDFAQPCVALLHDNRAVSVCRSVRITPRAHEAGLETLDEFRGRGYASVVAAGWAREVRRAGAVPLYSTGSDNLASQRVAGKLGLFYYGVNFTIV